MVGLEQLFFNNHTHMHNTESPTIVTKEEQEALIKAMETGPDGEEKSPEAKRQGLIACIEGEPDPHVIEKMLEYYKKISK